MPLDRTVFEILTQHDPDVHLPTLWRVITLRFRNGYNAPYYYMIVGFLSLPFVAPFRLDFISNVTFFKIATVLSNAVFMTVCLYGCLLLARQLRLRFSAQIGFIALCLFFPPVQRSFSMLRPENLLLTLAPYACVYCIVIWRSIRAGASNANIPAIVPAVGLLTPVAAQKISGMFFAFGLGAITFAFVPGTLWQRITRLSRPTAMLCGLVIVLLVAQRIVGGTWFYQGNQAEAAAYHAMPRAEIFVNFSPTHAWQEPFRNKHANSMPNILLIDMFGDYWRYGIDHYASKEPGNTIAWRLARARFGLLTSALFLGLYGAGIIVLLVSVWGAGEPELRTLHRERVTLAAAFFIGIAMLILSSLAGYNASKFDVIKWEYIIMFIPFLMIPLAHLIDVTPKGRWEWAADGAVAIVVLAGILQSIRYVPG